ncbi:MAG: hypothetical protein AAF206_21560 [Bacteroidota bacterium]
MKAYNEGDYDWSIPLFMLHVETNPQDAGAIFYLGVAQLGSGDASATLESLASVSVGTDSLFVEPARWYQALAHLKMGQALEGKMLLEKIRQLPQHFRQTQADSILQQLSPS